MKRGEIIDSIKAIEGARVAISRHDHDRANKAESLKSLEQLKNEPEESSGRHGFVRHTDSEAKRIL
jgi:hypothetical protein